MSLNLSMSLIAGLLYATAYFQFLNVLRYRRNMVQTSKIEIGKSVVLVILVLAVVSVSPGEFDFAALALSALFIVLLFFVIAAPAIAFIPTVPIVEPFAKHGDYAGLWFAPFALAAGIVLPNAGLRGMLLSAILLELIWYVHRRRQDWHRVMRPLSDPALTILERQANGDLAGFKRKHRIGELVLGKSVGWLGCTKSSAPCPFNLYVNKLGLNTAPCCHDHLIALCHFAVDCLSDEGSSYWLEGGTLLGAIREGGMLDWEDDVDISVLLDHQMTWDRLLSALSQKAAAEGYAVEVFPEIEVISIGFDRRQPWPFGSQRNRLRGELRVDIVGYREGVNAGQPVLERFAPKGAMPATESGKYGVPVSLGLPTSQMSVFDRSVDCPQDPDVYLRLLYGDYTKIAYTYIDPQAAEKRADNVAPRA
ncbi:MAG: LicD family protein [Pirellulaceae bacterium]|nr:LicD family protein [Pirellulaceae bacterium]